MAPGCSCTSKCLTFSTIWAQSKRSWQIPVQVSFPFEGSQLRGQNMFHTAGSLTRHLCSLNCLRGPNKFGHLRPPRTFPLRGGRRACSLRKPLEDTTPLIRSQLGGRASDVTAPEAPPHPVRRRGNLFPSGGVTREVPL